VPENPLTDPLTEARVAEFLSESPDFFTRHPDLLESMTPVSKWNGDDVVDMQDYMLKRLRGRMENLRASAMEVIDASRTNMLNQARAHVAALAVIEAHDFEDMATLVGDSFPEILSVDAASMGFEPAPGVLALTASSRARAFPEGLVGRLLPDGEDVLLIPEASDDGTFFGDNAGLVRSAAVARLHAGTVAPAGLLCLASRETGLFHAELGTDLVRFLADVVQRCVNRCLERPA
jgi:uncharacterized protein